MDWYTLDTKLDLNEIIENFQSFIWTERYSASGDFQIVTKSTFPARQMLTPGVLISKRDSYYVMKIDTVVDETDDSGIRNLTVTGQSMEALLNDRVAMPAMASTTVTPQWIINDTPGNIARYMFNQVCVNTVLSTLDTFPFYALGTLLPTGDIPETPDVITATFSPDTLYNSIKSICDAYGLGFRVVFDSQNQVFYFEVYTGNDLTTDQYVNTPVVFSPDFETLSDLTMLTSTSGLKTVAYVFAQNGTAVVASPYAASAGSGLNRRVLLVNSSNTLPAGANLTAALQQEGLQSLTAAQKIYQFDGTIPQNIPYVYGVDYGLGDVVEERNSDGLSNQMIITEQIFVSDDTGERSYPTLTLVQEIIPGAWLAAQANETWNEVNPTTTWDNA